MKVILALFGALAFATAAPQAKAGTKALIPDVAAEIGCTIAIDLVAKAGLTELLSGEGPFTVIAPINEAFAAIDLDALAANVEALRYILLSHYYVGLVNSSDLVNEQTFVSMSGSQIRVNKYGDITTINGALVVEGDIAADNGVIEVTKQVLFPISNTNLTGMLVADPRFTTLRAAIEVAGLTETLTGDGPFTLFAPTDSAFAALPEGVLDALLADPVALKQVLLGHVVSGTFFPDGLPNGTVIPTLDGGSASIINLSGIMFIDAALVIEPQKAATNGALYIINAVI